MQTPASIEGLSAIAARYDALLCDAWGVIHDGVRLFDGAAEALVNFRRERGPVIVLTNAPRPHWIIPPQLDRLGLPRSAYDAVVTSGDATRAEIEKRLGSPAYRIGPTKDEGLFDGLAIEFVPLAEAAFIVCTGLVDDEREAPEDYRAALEQAAGRRLPMICANPDIVVRWGGRLIWCAGALAELYESLGGAVVYGGKPHRPIYDLALARIAAIAGAPVSPSRTLAIGDSLRTDIEGARRSGIDAVLIAGAHGVHERSEESFEQDMAGVMETLRW